MSPSRLQVSSSVESAGGLQRSAYGAFGAPTNQLRYLSRHAAAGSEVATPFTVSLHEVSLKPIEAGEVLATKFVAWAPTLAPPTAPTPSGSVAPRFGLIE